MSSLSECTIISYSVLFLIQNILKIYRTKLMFAKLVGDKNIHLCCQGDHFNYDKDVCDNENSASLQWKK